MRTIVYVDGFNLYYAIRGTGFKWLNLKALADIVLPAPNKVLEVKYFTARVSGQSDPDAPRRQQVYLNALRTVPEISMFFGRFLAKTHWRPVVNLPVAHRDIGSMPPTNMAAGIYRVDSPPGRGNRPETLCVGSYSDRGKHSVTFTPDKLKVEVHAMEEKGSDVNLACHLVNDAWMDRFDVGVVVSNDSDLVEPIRITVEQRRLPVVLLAPPTKYGPSSHLTKVATEVRHIHNFHLRQAQFPSNIPGTNISRPRGW